MGPLRKDLKEAIRQGRARKVDEELAVYALLGTADFLCYRATLDSRYTPQEIAEFVQDWVDSALHREPTPTSRGGNAKGHFGTLVDLDGMRTELQNVLFDEEPLLQGVLGRAAIGLDPAKVESIAVRDSGDSSSTCTARVTMKDRETAALQIRGDVVVSGETALGAVRIPLRDVSSLTFL